MVFQIIIYLSFITHTMNKNKALGFLMYVLACICIWFAISLCILNLLPLNNYKRTSGIITAKEEVSETQKSRRRSREVSELRIQLTGSSDYYRFQQSTSYERFVDQITEGKPAEIYTLPTILALITTNSPKDIFHLTVDGRVLYSIDETRKNTKGIMLFCLIAAPIFFFIGRWLRKIEL